MNSKPLRAIFIDPGIRTVGWSLFSGSKFCRGGQFSVRLTGGLQVRTEDLIRKIEGIIGLFAAPPDEFWIEGYIVRHDPKSVKGAPVLFAVGALYGVLAEIYGHDRVHVIKHGDWTKAWKRLALKNRGIKIPDEMNRSEHVQDAFMFGMGITNYQEKARFCIE